MKKIGASEADIENAKKILEELKKEKVEFIGNFGDDMTGYSIVLDSIEDDRTILTYKGVNDHLCFEKIKKAKLQTKWFYFSSMINESYTTLEKLSEFAQKKGILIAFNPSSYLAKKGMHFVKKIIQNTNVLILNMEEANLLLGMVNAKPEFLLKGLHFANPKYVIITNGNKGVHAYDGKTAYFIPSHHVKVVETTGAGDAFASAFIASLIKTNNFKKSLKIAMVNAESILMHKGAKNKLLKWNEAVNAISKESFEFHNLRI